MAKFNVKGMNSVATQVAIATPKNGAATGGQVDVAASASGNAVGWMQVYVDGARKTQVAGDTVNTALSLAVGQRRITVQAINKDGSVAKSTVYVTVK